MNNPHDDSDSKADCLSSGVFETRDSSTLKQYDRWVFETNLDMLCSFLSLNGKLV